MEIKLSVWVNAAMSGQSITCAKVSKMATDKVFAFVVKMYLAKTLKYLVTIAKSGYRIL